MPNRLPAGFLALMIYSLSLAGCVHSEATLKRLSFSRGSEIASGLTDQQVAGVHIAFGRMLEKRGDYSRAMAAYYQAVRRDSIRPDAYLRLAILCDRQGRFGDSARLFRRALESDPGNPDIFADVGYSLYIQRRWEEAEMNLRQALIVAPEHPRAHNNLGLVLASTGRIDEALAEFRLGGTTEADAHVNVALAASFENRWDAAREHFQLALAADPSSDLAQDGLSEIDRLALNTPTVPRTEQTAAPLRQLQVATISPKQQHIALVAHEEHSSGRVDSRSWEFHEPTAPFAGEDENARLATLVEIAVALASIGELLEAERTVQAVEDQENAQRGQCYQVKAWSEIAKLHASRGNNSNATDALQRAVKAAGTLAPGPARDVAVLETVAARAALGAFNQAGRTASTIEDPLTRQRALSHVAFVEAERGFLREALERIDALDAPELKDQATSTVAVIQMIQGDLQGSLHTVGRIQGRARQATTLARLATVSVESGDSKAADHLLEQALVLCETPASTCSEIEALVSIAAALRATASPSFFDAAEIQRRRVRASSMLQRALQATADMNAASAVRHCALARIASLHADWGEIGQARRIAEELAGPPRNAAIQAIAAGQAAAGDIACALQTAQAIEQESSKALAVQSIASVRVATSLTMDWLQRQPSSLVKARALLGMTQGVLRADPAAARESQARARPFSVTRLARHLESGGHLLLQR